MGPVICRFQRLVHLIAEVFGRSQASKMTRKMLKNISNKNTFFPIVHHWFIKSLIAKNIGSYTNRQSQGQQHAVSISEHLCKTGIQLGKSSLELRRGYEMKCHHTTSSHQLDQWCTWPFSKLIYRVPQMRGKASDTHHTEILGSPDFAVSLRMARIQAWSLVRNKSDKSKLVCL